MSSQYLRGRVKEYKVRDMLLEEGFTHAQRTAGSHSPVDVIAWKEDEVVFAQCKWAKSKSSYKKDLAKFVSMKVPISVTKRFYVATKYHGICKIYEN